MDRYSFDVRLTPSALELLEPDEALVIDWHRMAICCAGAGEMSLYAMKEARRGDARAWSVSGERTRSTPPAPSSLTSPGARS
jgi:hypothetical protein